MKCQFKVCKRPAEFAYANARHPEVLCVCREHAEHAFRACLDQLKGDTSRAHNMVWSSVELFEESQERARDPRVARAAEAYGRSILGGENN